MQDFQFSNWNSLPRKMLVTPPRTGMRPQVRLCLDGALSCPRELSCVPCTPATSGFTEATLPCGGGGGGDWGAAGSENRHSEAGPGEASLGSQTPLIHWHLFLKNDCRFH